MVQSVTDNRALLDHLTDALIEKETIDYLELAEMRDKFTKELTPA